MYVRMSHKGICIISLCLLAAVPARALEERIELLPGQPRAETASTARAIGDWRADGAVLRKGFKGGMDYVVADQVYAPDASVDLLLHFDGASDSDETGNWSLSAGSSFSIDRARALLGGGAGSFRGPDSSLMLSPRPGSIFGKPRGGGSGFRDFSIEFWLFPANADNGEVILLWRSLRKLPSGVQAQQLSCVVSGGRLSWSFSGFFVDPVGAKGEGQGAAKAADSGASIELRGLSPLVPRAWSHHLLRFDGDTGLIEYLVDGRPEATAYATASGREGGTVFEPAVGAAAPLEFCPSIPGSPTSSGFPDDSSRNHR